MQFANGRNVAQAGEWVACYRTASGSDRMLRLNYGLRAKGIARLTVASGRYRSRFCKDLLLLLNIALTK
jgi:hypothetical protein